MPEISLGTPMESRPAKRPGSRGLGVLFAGFVLVAFGAAAWLGWHDARFHDALAQIDSRAALAPPAGAGINTAAATTSAIVAQGNLAATNAALADATARLTALQTRLIEIDSQTLAASAQATRAEALLIALATRRSVERGQPLGYLESALRVRFGNSQATAVDQIVAATKKPVTIGGLTEEFATLEPRLVNGPANEGPLDWLTRQLGAIFIIRHDDTPSPAPESRLARARAELAGQRLDLAIAEVQRMPGKDAAADWLAHAREWENTQAALDQIESAALATPLPTAVTPKAATSTSTPTSAP